MAERKKFTVNTEPHVAEVGDDEFLFKPEAYTDELIEAWASLRVLEEASAATQEKKGDGDKIDPTDLVERTKRASSSIRQFIASMMLEESVPRFNEVKLPDRVLIEMMRWVMEVYGLRPTGSSNDSSESSSTTKSGDESTETSSDEELTS